MTAVNERSIYVTEGKNLSSSFKIDETATLYQLSVHIQKAIASHLKLENILFGNGDVNWSISKGILKLNRKIYEKVVEHRSFEISEKDQSPSIKDIYNQTIKQIGLATNIPISSLKK